MKYPAALPFVLLTMALLAGCGSPEQESAGPSDPLILPPLDIYPQGYLAPDHGVTLTFQPSDEKPVRTVYRLVYPKLDKEYAQGIADKMGVKGEARYETNEDGPAYSFEDDDAFLDVVPGSFVYSLKSESHAIAGEISDADAIEKVRSFLAERGLLPEDAQFDPVSRSHDGSIDVSAGNTSIPVLFFVFPLFPPFMISASLDPAGNLKMLWYSWPETESLGDYTLLSESEAHQETLSADGETAPGAKATVNSFELSYYTASGSEEQYLVPVYCAMGNWSGPSADDRSGCIAPIPAIPADMERRGDPDWKPKGDETPESGG